MNRQSSTNQAGIVSRRNPQAPRSPQVEGGQKGDSKTVLVLRAVVQTRDALKIKRQGPAVRRRQGGVQSTGGQGGGARQATPPLTLKKYSPNKKTR